MKSNNQINDHSSPIKHNQSLNQYDQADNLLIEIPVNDQNKSKSLQDAFMKNRQQPSQNNNLNLNNNNSNNN